MGVYIKGMEMPRSCDSCPCYYETEGAWRNECQVLLKECAISEGRPSWCPLIELPPHGRLIDADALKKELYNRIPLAPLVSKSGSQLFTYDEMDIMDIISDQPTIIEAEPTQNNTSNALNALEQENEEVTDRNVGKWQITDAYPHNVYCSECHKKFAQTHWAVWEDGSLPRNFCPNCGADMRGRKDERTD